MCYRFLRIWRISGLTSASSGWDIVPPAPITPISDENEHNVEPRRPAPTRPDEAGLPGSVDVGLLVDVDEFVGGHI